MRYASCIEVREKPLVEKVLGKFAKMSLGIHSKATNAPICGELGIFPITLTHLKGIVKYPYHLQQMLQHSLIFKCFKSKPNIQHSRTIL